MKFLGGGFNRNLSIYNKGSIKRVFIQQRKMGQDSPWLTLITLFLWFNTGSIVARWFSALFFVEFFQKTLFDQENIYIFVWFSNGRLIVKGDWAQWDMAIGKNECGRNGSSSWVLNSVFTNLFEFGFHLIIKLNKLTEILKNNSTFNPELDLILGSDLNSTRWEQSHQRFNQN